MPVTLLSRVLRAYLPLVLLLGGTHSLNAQTPPANVAAEKWVIKKIATGEEAHLVEAFPNAEDRKVSWALTLELSIVWAANLLLRTKRRSLRMCR